MASIRWLSHAAFEIIHDEKFILVDPYLTGNHLAPLKASDVSKADIVCVTHDHSDHLGDSVDICKRTNATFVGVQELTTYAQSEGVKNVVTMKIGETVNLKGIKISMVAAIHSFKHGPPVGFVIGVGKSNVYHAGDTAVFSDMRNIGQKYEPEIACLPIGGYYTMDAQGAAEATMLIMPKVIIPMHYKTLPVIAQSADEFVRILKEKRFSGKILVLNIGESYTF